MDMPKGHQRQRRPADAIGCAVMVGRIATGEIIEILKESGYAGAAARAEKLSQKERTAYRQKGGRAPLGR
jgi:hypothetical protein